MTTTLLGALNGLSDLQQRCYLDTAPSLPATPFAIAYETMGGLGGTYYGGAALVNVYPSVTLYHKPGSGESVNSARQGLMFLASKVVAAVKAVDTHSDGVTPFITGSFQLQAEFPPMPDKSVQGQLYLTLRFAGSYWRP